MEIPATAIEEIVRRVVEQVQKGNRVEPGAGVQPSQVPPSPAEGPAAAGVLAQPAYHPGWSRGNDGIFPSLNEAIEAAEDAQRAYAAAGMAVREKVVEAMRIACRNEAHRLAQLAVEETGMGRIEDKVTKNILSADKTPGTEDLQPRAYSGTYGFTFEEQVPYGLIAAITPSTNPTSTVINNGICALAAGNAVVFNPHPGAKACTIETLQVLNRAIVAAGGPPNLLCSLAEPTIRTGVELMKHERINLIIATGGPGVVRIALQSGKKTIGAGPGNPPVIVDETADIDYAADRIVFGASFDNNIPCICEKEVFVVEPVADALITAMQRHGAYLLAPHHTQRLAQILVDGHTPNRDFVGKDTAVILNKIGLSVDPGIRLAIAETEFEHPFVQAEMLMPILPIVRVRNFDRAVDYAVRADHGFRHTAVIHSKDIERITRFAKAINTMIFVANGACGAGLGHEGEGHTALTIAGQTGEGLLTARHLTCARRLVLAKSFGMK